MAKYLRYISEWSAGGGSMTDLTLDDPVVLAAIHGHGVPGLACKYEFLCLPLLSGGVDKVNIFLTQDLRNVPWEDLPICPEEKPGDGIVSVLQSCDPACWESLGPAEGRLYHLELFHSALLRCAAHFGWDAAPFEKARRQLLADDFRVAFFWKKPLSSPDRRHRVQAWIDVKDQLRIFLVFSDKQQQELRRVLLLVSGIGSGPVESALGKISWRDGETVQVTQKNGRDYWLCRIDGEPEFHYPPAEAGKPQGLYHLGRKFLDGEGVLQDVPRGLELLRAAASQGFVQAQRTLDRFERQCAADRQDP